MEEIDSEIVLKSLVFVADGLAKNIGENGARALIRQCGHHAAANLMEEFPVSVDVAEAIQQACPILEALGFARQVRLADPSHVVVRGNAIAEMVRQLGLPLARHPVYHYPIGVFEGLVYNMCKTRIAIVAHEINDAGEIWTLGDWTQRPSRV